MPEGKKDLCLNGKKVVKLPSKQLVARSNRARDIFFNGTFLPSSQPNIMLTPDEILDISDAEVQVVF